MIPKSQRIVIKFGTGILTKSTSDGLETAQFVRLTTEVSQQVQAGHQIILVSSGAVGAGLMLLKLAERPTDLPSVQACAAVGQTRLMRLYETLFNRHGLHVAQLLLTHQDMDSRTRYENARNTLERLFEFGKVVPVINENDPVAVEELRFGDNDRLSAEVAILSQADLLIILTSVDGLINADGCPISQVEDVDSVLHLARDTSSAYSTGGMISKLQAVKTAVRVGIPAVIASGRRPGAIQAILQGELVGTRFSPCLRN
jgi:glutamate 5-kinase